MKMKLQKEMKQLKKVLKKQTLMKDMITNLMKDTITNK